MSFDACLEWSDFGLSKFCPQEPDETYETTRRDSETSPPRWPAAHSTDPGIGAEAVVFAMVLILT